MTCPACTNARQHPNSGRFNAGCQGCIARGISRLPQFHAARKAGRITSEYARLLADQLPKLEQHEAHAAVKEWAR